MIAALYEIRHAPIDKLRAHDHFVMAMTRYMTDVRAEANSQRLYPLGHGNGTHMTYLIGRLHGLRFGMSTQLIYSAGSEGMAALEWADSLLHEADFLSGRYQGART
jgi:hypothetical protein